MPADSPEDRSADRRAALPARPNLEHLKSQAKALLRAYREGDPAAVASFRAAGATPAGRPAKLADAQRLVARGYGFSSWPKLAAHVKSVAAPPPPEDPLALVRRAFHESDAALLREVLGRHPELRAKVNEPLFPFDSPAINFARTRAVLDVLLDAGADINARSRWWAGGFGILHSAEPDLARYAIERGAAVDVHAAARLGMVDRLQELVEADPSVVHARGGDGQTPLHFAATADVANYLLDRGADADARDIDHESTPAQYMARDRQDVARLLVRRGCATDLLLAAALGDVELARKHLDADPACVRTAVNERWFPKRDPRAGGCIYIWTLGANKSAHQVARDFRHDDVYRLLMERSPAELKLAQACAVGDEDAARSLLADDPALTKKLSEDTRRRLPDAAQANDTAAVRRMLEAGWPVDARGQHRGTALHWAAWHGNAEMVRQILRHRPPLEDADNEFGATPLGWATHGSEHGWHRDTGDYPATIELLRAAGAKPPADLSGSERGG